MEILKSHGSPETSGAPLAMPGYGTASQLGGCSESALQPR